MEWKEGATLLSNTSEFSFFACNNDKYLKYWRSYLYLKSCYRSWSFTTQTVRLIEVDTNDHILKQTRLLRWVTLVDIFFKLAELLTKRETYIIHVQTVLLQFFKFISGLSILMKLFV